MNRLAFAPPHAPATGYAADRWAKAVVAVLNCDADPKSLVGWSYAAGAAQGTLRGWCRTAGISAKISLDFARMLRAVLLSEHEDWEPENLLNIVDARTLTRLLGRSGIGNLPRG